jgi:hypothetical protein
MTGYIEFIFAPDYLFQVKIGIQYAHLINERTCKDPAPRVNDYAATSAAE